MITKNTVFILGAGASADFGFPLGQKLREKIIQRFNKSGYEEVQNIAKALSLREYEVQDYIRPITTFANKLNLDVDYSIDAFLERFQKSYLTIGKLAIAQILAKSEDESIFYGADNWYRLVYNEMKRAASIDTLKQNKISFITFNYDRSLEHFLYTSLLSYHENITETNVLAILGQIPIVHIYGQLDPLPWQSSGGRAYGSRITLGQLKSYMENINIIFENMTEKINVNFQKAIDLLKQAEKIYILGFGFHPTNVDKLNLKEIQGKNIIATSYGLSQEQIGSIRGCLGSKKGYPSITLYSSATATRDMSNGTKLYNMSAYDLISQYSVLD